MKRMCQIDDWKVTQATLVSKLHKKMGKNSSTNVPSVIHCHPDKKSVHIRVWSVHVCARVCIMAAPSDGVALL